MGWGKPSVGEADNQNTKQNCLRSNLSTQYCSTIQPNSKFGDQDAVDEVRNWAVQNRITIRARCKRELNTIIYTHWQYLLACEKCPHPFCDAISHVLFCSTQRSEVRVPAKRILSNDLTVSMSASYSDPEHAGKQQHMNVGLYEGKQVLVRVPTDPKAEAERREQEEMEQRAEQQAKQEASRAAAVVAG